MRRMLDPKEAGGGGTPRHAYSITINSSCHYEAYTAKDYNYKIGEMVSVNDFMTNTKYNELRTERVHPASGFYYYADGDLKIVVYGVEVDSAEKTYIRGFDLTNSTFKRLNVIMQSVKITQLY